MESRTYLVWGLSHEVWYINIQRYQDIPSYLAFVFRTSSGIILQYQCGKVNEKSNLRLGMVITICESAA
jgi:hypothetical protein